jgi:uncharacterized delta-60 repeat protein
MNAGYFLSKSFYRMILVVSMLATLLFATGVLAAGGVWDPTFGTNGAVVTDLGSGTDTGNSLLIQPDGRILMLGYAQLDQSNPNLRTPIIVRYNTNGTVDTSFGTDGKLIVTIGTFYGTQTALQSDGRLVIVSGTNHGQYVAVRYDANGKNMDPSFGTNGVAVVPSFADDFFSFGCSDIVIQPDQKIVVVGTEKNQGNFTDFVIARFNSNGTPDTSFIANGIFIMDRANFPNNRFNNGDAIAIQPDGKIVIAGHMVDYEGDGQISLTRLNTDGFPDISTFGSNGKGTVTIPLANYESSNGALALQNDGKFVVVGSIFSYEENTNDDVAVARFTSNGSLDTTFGGSGIVVTDFGENENGNDVVLQPNGKIIVVGRSYSSGFSDVLLVRYNSDGSLDTTFGDNGKVISDFGGTDTSKAAKLQPDGKIVLVGSSNGDALLARYNLTDSGVKPVTATFKSNATYDGWILETSENSGVGGTLDRSATTFNLGDDQKDRQYRSVMSFNTLSIPDNAFITSAELRIKRQGVVGTDPFNTHGTVLVDIRNGAFGGSLSLQIVDFSASASPESIQEQISRLDVNWYSNVLDPANLRFINKYGHTQFKLSFSLDDNDDLGSDYVKFFSGDSTSANQPQLIVTYYVP